MELLQRALNDALDRNASETAQWLRYKEQHEGAKASIEEFNKSLEVDIMVPVGAKALIPGRLYHTNEILVTHSGTYYSKCSAHKALQFCKRRLDIATERLNALATEADMYRNKLYFPQCFDAFSSEEIVETYDEEEEKRWQADHKKKMRAHKQKEAEKRRKLTSTEEEDDILKRLDELELMEELENELETISVEDCENIEAILNAGAEQTSHKNRISHLNEHVNGHVSPAVEASIENDDAPPSSDEEETDDDHDDDDDIPPEFKAMERETVSMTTREKLKFLKAKLGEVQHYLENYKPRTIEEISHKTDKIFLSDHVVSAIEIVEDELNCEEYLKGENVINEDSDDDIFTYVIPSVPKETETVLSKKKKVSFDLNEHVKIFDESEPIVTSEKETSSEDSVQSFDNCKESTQPIARKVSFASEDNVKTFVSWEQPKKLFKKISFAEEDDVKSFDTREEPKKISSTVIFEEGPVLSLNVNHSEAVFNGTSGNPDVIRSPVDIYKQFAEYTLTRSNNKERTSVIPKKDIKFTSKQQMSQELRDEPIDNEVTEAKIEVKEMLDNIFGSNIQNEPDQLPSGDFVDTHQPKKRVSLFKQRRQMKSQ